MHITLSQYKSDWGASPNVECELEFADDSALHFCGAVFVGAFSGHIPAVKGADPKELFDELMEATFNGIKDWALNNYSIDEVSGLRLIMADSVNSTRFELIRMPKIEHFAEWLSKKYPRHMTDTKVCRNPSSGNPTKVWVFQIP